MPNKQCHNCGMQFRSVLEETLHSRFCRECNKLYCKCCMYSDTMCFSCAEEIGIQCANVQRIFDNK